MSKKNYKELAAQILARVGGKENVNRVYHCQTRLRFTLADESKADKTALEALDGVRKVMISSGVYQVVIGTDVADVFEELEPLAGTVSGRDAAPAEKKGVVSTVVDFVSSVFMPVIPALSGAGILKALLALLVVFHLIDNTSQTYAIFNFFSDSVFYFLPMLPAVLLYIGDDTMRYFYNIIIALVITAAVTAVVTFVLSLKFETETASPAAPSAPGSVAAPVGGKLVDMADIPDETFAIGVLGQGVGIIPSEGFVKAPFTGTVTTVADSKHAIGLASPDGMELLIHV